MRAATLPGRIGVVLGYSLGFQVLYLLGLTLLTVLFVRNVPADPKTLPRVVVVVEGQPLLSRGLWTGRWSDWADLDGKPVALVDAIPVDLGAQMVARSELQNWDAKNLRNFSAVGFSLNDRLTDRWYFVQERLEGSTTGFFINYTAESPTRPLYLGASGLSTTPLPSAGKFQLQPGANQSVVGEGGYPLLPGSNLARPIVDSDDRAGALRQSGILYVLTPTGLDKVDLAAKTVERIVEASDLHSLNAQMRHKLDARNTLLVQERETSSVLLRGRDILYQIENNKVAAKFVIPERLRDWNFTAFVTDPNRIAYSTTLDRTSVYGTYAGSRLLQSDARGQVLKETQIPQPEPESGKTQPQQLVAAIAFPAPIQLSLMLLLKATFNDRPLTLSSEYWLALGVPLVWGCLAVLGAWRLTPRFSGAPAHWGWLALVFVLGLPGMVGYLLHFRRPLRPVLAPAARLDTELFALGSGGAVKLGLPTA